MIKCSLINPAYNSEKTINCCLDAALNQSISKDAYEIIVADDGSIDNTANIVSKYDSVKLIRQSNHGPATARNHGAKEAKGEILIFTDSDCEIDADFIKYILYQFEKNAQIVGVQGAYKTKQKEFIAQFGQAEIETRYIKMEQNRYIDFIGTYAAAYRADVFRRYGGFDTSFPAACGEDAELSYRLNEDGYKLVFSRLAFAYHLHPTTLKKYLRVKFYRGFWRVRLHKKHLAKTFKDTYTPHFLKIEILISPILPFFMILSYWNVYFWIPILFIIPFFSFSSFSFLKIFKKMQYRKSYFVPFMLYARAISVFAGVCFGIINEVFLKKR
jgi:glycosyltransferase involved in cell wall biosynthesis